jgi:hypothetical protein
MVTDVRDNSATNSPPRRWVRFRLRTLTLVAMPILYFLSLGPALWMHNKRMVETQTIEFFYRPIIWLRVHKIDSFHRFMMAYAGLLGLFVLLLKAAPSDLLSVARIKRLRFRFSLRTLFIALTVGCLALGYYAYHARWAAKRRLEMARWCTYTMSYEKRPIFPEQTTGRIIYDSTPFPFPFGLELVGEKPMRKFIVHYRFPEKVALMKSLFPEAEVLLEERPPGP